jgi:hypothetical protein
MKLIHLFFSALFLLSITSCSKDEESSSINTADLVGTWNLVSIECNDGISTTEFFGQQLNSTFTVTGKDYKAKVTFGANPNTYLSQGSYTTISKLNTGGVIDIQEIPFVDISLNGTWGVDGNKLIVSTQGEPDQVAEIIKLNSQSFEYKISVNESFEEMGVKVTSKGTYITKLSR